MQVIFTPAARVEVFEAQDWYENQQTGLGTRFREQVEAAVARMIENPHQFPTVYHDVRRTLLRSSPTGSSFRWKRTF